MRLQSVIHSNFQDLRRRKSFEEKRDLPLRTIASETGLALGTIHRVNSGDVSGLRLATVDTLCRYFNVKDIDELLEYVPGESVK